MSNSDVQHCGPNCNLDCTEANATAACGTGNQCANVCNHSTLNCPASAKPACGSWDFESGTEGWFNTSNKYGTDGSGGRFSVVTGTAISGSKSLAIGHVANTAPGADAYSLAKVTLCPSGAAVDLSAKTLSVSVYAQPDAGTSTADLNLVFDCEMYVWGYPTGGGYLNPNNGSQLLPMNTWTTMTAILGPGITDIEVQFRTYNNPWSGTIYFDDIRIQP
jgi:hypothetical protein